MLEQERSSTAPKLASITLSADYSTPLYIQLAQQLAHAIQSGHWSLNEALPSERVLSEQLKVSRVTARKAIEVLIGRGMLERRRGSGTYITHKIEQATGSLTSFSAQIRDRGFRPGSRWLTRMMRLATHAESLRLEIPQGSRVAHLRRLRLADSEIMSVEDAVLPEALVPSPEEVEISLYDYLGERGTVPARATQRIRAINASVELARLTGVAVGEAMLLINRISYLEDGRVAELTDSYCRSDRYDFISEMGEIRPIHGH